ncbi:MAG: nucleotidyltransferase domain-containing protein, partial [Epsilonproteobacteria bacterium]|nr:nucleotidyltransferase domain-containing protein [Campylobacterota bacterium]NPA64629.1 nucleotidyltransferase domain-containing protein [Campylobacterota bacterium]
IVLFGSRAKGYATTHSDIDIAVDLKLDFRSRRKLKEKVEECSGIYSVDLVFLPEVLETFAKQIEKEGKVLYEKK